MISNQILQNTIEGLKTITRVELCIMDVDGKVVAMTADEMEKCGKPVAEFAKSPADSQEIQGYQFFKIFDETFLDLYPDFIDNFNQLLRPECRITLKKGAPLSTELRIYAFVRLGVEESVKIAQILHCSVSTIYTYRNRMRGRAINRDTFEQDVMRL